MRGANFKKGDIVYPYMCTPEYQKANSMKINHIRTVETEIRSDDGVVSIMKHKSISEDGFSWYPESTLVKDIVNK